MKGKKHSPEQIIKKLREAETMIAAGKPICRSNPRPRYIGRCENGQCSPTTGIGPQKVLEHWTGEELMLCELLRDSPGEWLKGTTELIDHADDQVHHLLRRLQTWQAIWSIHS